MLARDFVRYAGGSIRAHRLRSGLTALGIAIGIGAVVLLTSIGEGVNRYVVEQFTAEYPEYAGKVEVLPEIPARHRHCP